MARVLTLRTNFEGRELSVRRILIISKSLLVWHEWHERQNQVLLRQFWGARALRVIKDLVLKSRKHSRHETHSGVGATWRFSLLTHFILSYRGLYFWQTYYRARCKWQISTKTSYSPVKKGCGDVLSTRTFLCWHNITLSWGQASLWTKFQKFSTITTPPSNLVTTFLIISELGNSFPVSSKPTPST